MTNKKFIQKQWDANLYQNHHAFVWKYGVNLIEILSPKPGERILDLGCGTGQLTNQIAAAEAEVIGIDNSPTMITQASQNYPNIQFQVADARNLTFSKTFHAVFSNAVLHWIKPPEAVVSCVWEALKPGGRFVAEFGVQGNIVTILDAINRMIKDRGYPIKEEWNP